MREPAQSPVTSELPSSLEMSKFTKRRQKAVVFPGWFFFVVVVVHVRVSSCEGRKSGASILGIFLGIFHYASLRDYINLSFVLQQQTTSMQSGSTAGFRDFHHFLMQISVQEMKGKSVWSVVFIPVSLFYADNSRLQADLYLFQSYIAPEIEALFSVHLVLI